MVLEDPREVKEGAAEKIRPRGRVALIMGWRWGGGVLRRLVESTINFQTSEDQFHCRVTPECDPGESDTSTLGILPQSIQ